MDIITMTCLRATETIQNLYAQVRKHTGPAR